MSAKEVSPSLPLLIIQLPISIPPMKASPRFGTGATKNGEKSPFSKMQDWNFAVGSVAISPGVAREIDPGCMYSALARHAAGDWGDIAEADRRANAHALACRGRIISAHHSGSKKFWIVTDAGHSHTRIFRPREYARLKITRNS